MSTYASAGPGQFSGRRGRRFESSHPDQIPHPARDFAANCGAVRAAYHTIDLHRLGFRAMISWLPPPRPASRLIRVKLRPWPPSIPLSEAPSWPCPGWPAHWSRPASWARSRPKRSVPQGPGQPHQLHRRTDRLRRRFGRPTWRTPCRPPSARRCWTWTPSTCSACPRTCSTPRSARPTAWWC